MDFASQQDGLVVEVEGNIGSGKSHLVKRLAQAGGGRVMRFMEHNNQVFLKAFYDSPQQYGFAFQMYMLTTRLQQHDDAARVARTQRKHVFLDRGAVGDTLFALLGYRNGNLTDCDMRIYYSECRRRMPRSISAGVDVLVYLDVAPDECHRRMSEERQNDAEEGVPRSYLESVDTEYVCMLLYWLSVNRQDGGGSAGCTPAWLREKYRESNMGSSGCPLFVGLDWSHFGDEKHVAEQIDRVVCGRRRNPRVRFLATKPVESGPYVCLYERDMWASDAAFTEHASGEWKRRVMRILCDQHDVYIVKEPV